MNLRTVPIAQRSLGETRTGLRGPKSALLRISRAESLQTDPVAFDES